MERGAATWKPNVEISPNCPRCGSSNTKFCYYNNYSLTQPRYFCKGCRRYWTKGGSLRNVPVGGGCRKNRRAKSVRLSNHHHHHHGGINPNSRSLSYGGLPYNNSNNSLVESSSTSSGSSPHIDLALVYANFLNQPPDTKTSSSSTTAVEMPVSLPNEFDPLPPLGFSTMGNLEEDNNHNHNNNSNGINVGSLLPTTAAESHHHLRLDHNNHQGIMYNDVFDSVLVHQKHDDRDGIHHQLCSSNLPPLPSEDMVTHQDHDQMLWLNSHHHHHHHTVEAAAQEPMMLAPEAHDPSNLLFGNWSPFDFSSDDTISKT